MGRRKWTAEEKAAASLAGKERMAKRWAEGRRAQAEVFSMGTSEAPHAVVLVKEEPITGEYNIGEQKVVFTPNHTVIFEKKPEEPIRDQVRVGSREIVLRVRTDGQMVSLQGPCLCGAVKREWHQICLKQQ